MRRQRPNPYTDLFMIIALVATLLLLAIGATILVSHLPSGTIPNIADLSVAWFPTPR